MRSLKWLSIVFLIVLSMTTVSAVAIPGQSTTPDQSLPYNLKIATNLTVPDTVVIVVAHPEDYNVIALADEVANHIKAPVLITPPEKLSVYVVETISQMLAYGNLSKAIVIGTDENTTAIADLIKDIHDPLTGKDITVINVIYADTPEELSKKVAVYEWSSSNSVIVTDGYVQADLSKAIMMSAIDNIPILYEQLSVDEIKAVMTLLGANTIYVTPAVDPDVISALQTNYTVNDTWHNLTMSKDLEDFILDAQTAKKNATIVVVKESDLTPYDEYIYAMSILNTANISIVVAENSTTLGSNQTTFLSSNKPSMVVLLGNLSVASEALSNELSATVGKVPWRIVYDNRIDEITELALAGSGYYYPVVIVEYTATNGHFEYKFKNIGYSDVVKFDKYSLRVTFEKESGMFVDSVPAPVAQNETVVVYEFKDPIYPHDYALLTFNITEGTKFNLIPKLEYYAYTPAGTIKPLQSFFDYVISYFEKAKDWFVQMFNKLVGVLSYYLPLPNYAVMVIAGFLTFLILWSFIGLILYAISLLMGRRVENAGWYGLIVWVIEKLRRR